MTCDAQPSARSCLDNCSMPSKARRGVPSPRAGQAPRRPCGHAADWFPSEVLPSETWLLSLMKVVGAVVMYVDPVTVGPCPASRSVTGRATAEEPSDTAATVATARWTAAAPAGDTGPAIAILISAVATTT